MHGPDIVQFLVQIYIQNIAPRQKQQPNLLVQRIEAVRIVDVLIAHGGGVRAGKAFMKLVGVDCGQCRYPIGPVSDEEMKCIEEELRKTLFFEFI